MTEESYELQHLNDGWGEEFRLQAYLLGQYNELARSSTDHLQHHVEMLVEQNSLIRSIKDTMNFRHEHSLIEEANGENDCDKSFQFSRENSTLLSSHSQLFDSRVRLHTADMSFEDVGRRHRRTTASNGNNLERAIAEIELRCTR